MSADGTIIQKIEKLDISDELAGIIYYSIQMAKSGNMTQEDAVETIAQWYFFDTGRQMLPENIISVMKHSKVHEYHQKIQKNVIAMEEKLKSIDEIIAGGIEVTSETSATSETAGTTNRTVSIVGTTNGALATGGTSSDN